MKVSSIGGKQNTIAIDISEIPIFQIYSVKQDLEYYDLKSENLIYPFIMNTYLWDFQNILSGYLFVL